MRYTTGPHPAYRSIRATIVEELRDAVSGGRSRAEAISVGITLFGLVSTLVLAAFLLGAMVC